MRGFEQDANVGKYPSGQTFDEAVLPYVYKFYIASYLGYMDKKLALGLVLRAQDYIGVWKHTFADSDRAVPAISTEILGEINKEPQPLETPENKGKRISRKTTLEKSVVFIFMKQKTPDKRGLHAKINFSLF